MRTMRKVTVGFGPLVSIPASVYKAGDSKNESFHLAHRDDGGPIKQKRFCDTCLVEVSWDDICRSFEKDDGTKVLFESSELDTMQSNDIRVERFIPADQVNPALMTGNHYYIGPRDGSDPIFATFVAAMEKAGRVGLLKTALFGRDRISVLTPVDGVLMLSLLFWPSEVPSPSEVPFKGSRAVEPSDVEMALTLMGPMDGNYDESLFTDASKASLQAFLERKSGDPSAITVTAPEDGKPAEAVQPSVTATLAAALKAQKEQTAAKPKPRRRAPARGKSLTAIVEGEAKRVRKTPAGVK